VQEISTRELRLEQTRQQILSRWSSRVKTLERRVKLACQESEEKVINDLMDQYIRRVFDRNRKMVDVIKIKEEIERKIDLQTDQ